MTLRIAAKVYDATEQAHFDEVVAPAIKDGVVEFLGELAPAQRDPLMAGARATLMLGQWPEPFGLVAIESLATGTPVIARRAGALTETIEHGVDGFLVDDLSEAALAVELVGDLDRTKIRERALERFSPKRMVDEYEQVYRQAPRGARPATADGANHRHLGESREPGRRARRLGLPRQLAPGSCCAISHTWPSGSANAAVRTPHDRSSGPLSSATPLASRWAAAASASSTQMVSWKCAPSPTAPTFAGPISSRPPRF